MKNRILFEDIRKEFLETIKRFAYRDNSDRPMYHVHFSKVEKIGINPRPMDPWTPVGLYAFPLGCYRKELLDDDLPLEFVSFYKDSLYAYILTFENPEKVLYLKERYPKLLSYVKKHLGKLDKHAVAVYLDEEKEPERGASLYKLVTRTLNSNVKSAVFFKNAGFDAIVDNYGRVIHDLEKYQTVFLPPLKYRVVERETIYGEEESVFRFPSFETALEHLKIILEQDFLYERPEKMKTGLIDYLKRVFADYMKKKGLKVTGKDLHDFETLFRAKAMGRNIYSVLFRRFPVFLEMVPKRPKRLTLPHSDKDIERYIHEILSTNYEDRRVERIVVTALLNYLKNNISRIDIDPELLDRLKEKMD